MKSALPCVYAAANPDGLYIPYRNNVVKLPPVAPPTAANLNLKAVLHENARTHLGRMFGPKA